MAVANATAAAHSTSSQSIAHSSSLQPTVVSSSMRSTRTTQIAAKLVRASIGIDFGSAQSAVVYSVQSTASKGNFHVCKDSILSRLRVVKFANLDTQAATLISYGKVSQGNSRERFLFGSEVADALEHGTIAPDQTIKWLKIALFDSSPNALICKHRIEEQINQLPDEARFIVSTNGVKRKINCHDLFSFYLGYLWRSALRHMRKKETCLVPWPELPSQDEYWDVNTADVEFEIAIAVPALATPQHCDMVSEAARMAGLTSPSIFSEPSVAAYYLLQLDFEEGHLPTSQVILVVDIGAGTAV
jgi:molecular chaperone DnaK (HSP70)